MAQLTSADLELIGNYKKARVLDGINSHLLDPKEGLSIVMCGDPDQHPEAYSYHKEDIVKAGCLDRIHPPAPLGGALRLAPNSRTNVDTPGYDTGLMYDLALVHAKKKIKTVALYVHAPCAIAEIASMSFAEIISEAFAAKQRIKSELPGMKVAVFCHIDNGTCKKTWFVCRQRWEEYHSHPMARLRLMYPDRVQISNALHA